MTSQTQTPTMSDLDDALHEYIVTRHGKEDVVQRKVLSMAQEAGLPAIQVSPSLGRLLSLLVHASGARRILEIGTLGGYSAIWMGRALPSGGTLLSLEVSEEHAEVARRAVAEAGLSHTIEIRVGPALDTLRTLSPIQRFDLVFIDANKDQYPEYLEWAIRLVRPGGMILADNVLRNGAVLQDPAPDTDAHAVQRFNDLVAQDPRLETTIIPTRNGSGVRDGLSVSWVRDESRQADAQFSRE
jgi:predicted O-methyltransferase YrrM